MGFSYTYHFGPGIMLEEGQIYRKVPGPSQKSCNHIPDIRPAVIPDFCPSCGQKVKYWIPEYREAQLWVKDDEDGPIFIGEFQVFDGGECRTGYYLGEFESLDNYGDTIAEIEISEIDRVRQELKETLEPLGLWDESKFKIYGWENAG